MAIYVKQKGKYTVHVVKCKQSALFDDVVVLALVSNKVYVATCTQRWRLAVCSIAMLC
jgi:hypothetical protein